jgi:hypothetical protein
MQKLANLAWIVRRPRPRSRFPTTAILSSNRSSQPISPMPLIRRTKSSKLEISTICASKAYGSCRPRPKAHGRLLILFPRKFTHIPPSSPVYNVTYVTQTTTSTGETEASSTAGYLGMFIIGMAVGATVCYGSGYYYPPYYYSNAYSSMGQFGCDEGRQVGAERTLH